MKPPSCRFLHGNHLLTWEGGEEGGGVEGGGSGGVTHAVRLVTSRFAPTLVRHFGPTQVVLAKNVPHTFCVPLAF